jgi:two-component sensor histidine kinase
VSGLPFAIRSANSPIASGGHLGNDGITVLGINRRRRALEHVFFCGLIFGHDAAIFAAAIAAPVGGYLSYHASSGLDFVSINGLFTITAAGTAVVAAYLPAEMRRVLHSDSTSALLLQEMAHRTKNNLAVLGAMIRMEAKNGEPAVQAALEGRSRKSCYWGQLSTSATIPLRRSPRA